MTENSPTFTGNAPPPPAPSAQRMPDGRFAPGSGGRPAGTKNKVARETLAKIKDLRDPAMTALAENVRKGNQQAIEFVLGYALPKGRTLELEGGAPGDIVHALITGEISADEAKQIATAVARLRELDELDALRERLDEIETLLKDGSE